ncbi:MAG: hypothetical protein ACLP6W_15010 [Bryobacteraceae bacterium]
MHRIDAFVDAHVRKDGLKVGTFFASGSEMTCGGMGRILLLRTFVPRGDIELQEMPNPPFGSDFGSRTAPKESLVAAATIS